MQRRLVALSVALIVLTFSLGIGQTEARLFSPALPPTTTHLLVDAWSLGGNLLVNPDFEDGFTQREDGAVRVAVGWQPWYLHDTAIEPMRRPEWSPEYLWLPSIRVLHGDHGQKIFNSWAIHDAGIYQKVYQVPVGARLEFSAWVQIWTSECDEICLSPLDKAQGCRGLTNGAYAAGVGIDPTGAAPAGRNLPLPTTIVWSDITPPAYDRWVRLSVQTVAQSSTVTVFTRSKPGIAVKHNDSYWDSADLRVVDDTYPKSLPQEPIQTAGGPHPADGPTQSTATPRPGPTLAPTPTITPALPTDPGPERGCWEAMENGGMEEGLAGWTVSGSPAVQVSTARAKAGQSALRLGDAGEANGLVADASRIVYLPANANRVTLSFWAWRTMSDLSPTPSPTKGGESDVSSPPSLVGKGAGGLGSSSQSVTVEELDGTPLVYALRPGQVTDKDWLLYRLDLTAYRGRNVRVRFHVTAAPGTQSRMDIDDVSLEVCRANGPEARARQAREILPRPETGQRGGMGVRLGYLRYGLAQPDFFAFPAACNAVTFEFAQLENFGPPVNLEGWTLADAAGNVFTFPYLDMPTGYRVRVWTSPGPHYIGQGVADLYAGFNGPIWGDVRDTLALRDWSGSVVTSYHYEWEE